MRASGALAESAAVELDGELDRASVRVEQDDGDGAVGFDERRSREVGQREPRRAWGAQRSLHRRTSKRIALSRYTQRMVRRWSYAWPLFVVPSAACAMVDEIPVRRDGGREASVMDSGGPVDSGVRPDTGVPMQDVATDRGAPPQDATAVDAARDTGVMTDTGVPVDSGSLCMPACRAGHRCISGLCLCGMSGTCAANQECCGDACVDVQSNTMNCGRCGNVCPAGQFCSAGTCTSMPMCAPACDVAQGERCVAPGICACGAGGTACPAGQVCNMGVCGSGCPSGCPAGEMCVGRSCVCGTTGATCPAGTECRSGRCVDPNACDPPCGAGLTCCNRACVNLRTDTRNCGACGRSCTPVLEACCAPFGLGSPQCTPILFC
jgi:hypothetical protein